MCLLVVGMIIVGGATRLTNSGLSITEWKPISGALPPLSHEHWLSEFEKYKQIPEFESEHPGMTLREFEFIYFWEWSHRQLGRITGLAFALPFFFLLVKKRLPKGRVWAFWAVLIGIGVQGAIGWWMVSSGLEGERVDVSPYRLATHLGAAFVLLGGLVWLALDSAARWRPSGRGVLTPLALALLLTTYLQIIAGAFMAGTHAGDTYKEWPLMDGDFVPQGYFIMSPPLRNLFENIPAIQFNHRILAYIVFALSLWLFIAALRKGSTQVKRFSAILLALVVWQVGIGIATLLHMDPHPLALKHQTTASILFIVAVITLWNTRRRDAV